jgi:predicted Zn-dependent peptidase
MFFFLHCGILNDMIHKEKLGNGLTLVTEKIPNIRSIAIGVWLLRGSRHEPDEKSGIYHFIEHMVFKGTTRRTSHDIAKIIDSIGGTLNAFTGKENTCFYVKVLDEHLEIAMELLSDLLLNPRFQEEDIEREKRVVIEEIKMVNDSPDEMVHNLFLESFWKNHPLSRPVLGFKKTVRNFSREALRKFYGRNLLAGNLLITVAGNLEHGRIMEMAAKYFHSLPPRVPEPGMHKPPEVTRSVSARKKKGLSQLYLCLGTHSYPRSHADRYILAVINTFLGTGMSSRLFQEIREERSLAYEVFSDVVSYTDAGYLFVYAGTRTNAVKEVVEIIVREFRKIKEGDVKAEELKRAKEHLKGSLMLGLESTFNRMSNLASNQIYFDKQFGLDEILNGIQVVTEEDVLRVSGQIFDEKYLSLKVLGGPDHLRVGPGLLKL